MATRSSSKTRLGRGLSSLISTTPPTSSDDEGRYFYCPVDQIDPMAGQPRRNFDRDRLEELATSIRESGLIQPLVVRQASGGRFSLIAGERRLRAARIAGLAEVPVVTREVADADAFALALIENIQREDLNPIEEALAYARLVDEHGFTQDQLAQRVGKSRSAVANALRLLKLGPVVRDLVSDGTLSAGHARAVLSVADDHQGPLAERIVTESLSVRAAEQLARTYKGDAPKPGSASPTPSRPDLSPQIKRVQRQLMEHFGTRVVIARKQDGSGTVELHFADDDGLQAILDTVFE